MSEELKPCPFCGGDASVGHTKVAYFVNCPDCLVATNILAPDSGQTKAEVIAAWNTRAPDADLTPRLAAAEAERDAAVARAKALADSYSKPFAAQVAEGERRATAAIVADLREFAASDRAKHFADRYEAGDHLKGTSNQ